MKVETGSEPGSARTFIACPAFGNPTQSLPTDSHLQLFDSTPKMPSPDDILSKWEGIIENDFSKTISRTFEVDPVDNYVYRAESFAMTLPQIQQLINSGNLKYKYQSHGKELDVR